MMSVRFLKLAALYLAIGIGMGLYMGITENFTLRPVHAHLNLLGFATLALAGVVYHLHPAAATTRLAHIHFWLHNLGLPVLMASLALLVSGHAMFAPIVGVASMVVGAGVLLFVVNVWINVKAQRRTGEPELALSSGARA